MEVYKYTYETKEIHSICPNCQCNFITRTEGPPKNCDTIMTEMIFRNPQSSLKVDRIYYFDNQKNTHLYIEPDIELTMNISIRTFIVKKTNMTYKQWKSRWCKED